MVSTARLLVPRGETTEREIELWIEHVGGHWNMPDMKRAVFEFEKAMLAEGLSDHTLEDLKRFYEE